MQKLPALFLLIFLSLHLSAQPKKKKVVFIIADGIPADVLEKTKHPFLDQIARSNGNGYKKAYVGGEKGGYSQTPTISAVGYNSLLTGTWVNKHNVWGNEIKDPNYYYPTIFRLAKLSDTAKKIAIFSTWQDNRTKLIGEGLPQTGNIKVDYHADGFELDTVNFPHDPQRLYLHKIDEKVTAEAEKCIRENGPDLTWVYLEYTDDMGHLHGDGPELKEAIGYTDQQVGRIWDAVQYRQKNFPEDWLVIVTTDHGRDSINGKNHGGQSARERGTWIVTNAKDLNHYWRDYTPGIVDIAPTIGRFLGLSIPRENAMEMDGTSLIGKVSIVNPMIGYDNGKLTIRWKAIDKEGTVKIWLATTNNFRTGGKDDYKLLIEVPVEAQSAGLGIGSYPSAFYKIVLETPSGDVNRWIKVP